jgi:processed acidic surface protein
MKKVGIIILSLAILFGMVPQTVSAAESETLEVELNAYLGEVSAERGFEVTKADLESYLSAYETKLTDFTSVDELRIALGEVIKVDLSNLNSLYESYKMDETALIEILAVNGEELKDYIYISELDYALFFYTNDNTFEREPDFDLKLVDYLSAISMERGFEVTKERLEEALAVYETRLDSFEKVEDVKDYMGEVIKADLSNLSQIYYAYRIDQNTLFTLLEKNGKSIDDYIYVYDLVEVAGGADTEIPIMDEAMLTEFLAMLDVTDAELNKIEAYMASMESYFSDPAFFEAFTSWTERISLLKELDGVVELSQEQVDQVVSYFNELFSLIKLKPVISFILDGQETIMSFDQLAQLEDFDYTTTDLKVTIYGTDGTLLADFNVTSEFVDYLSGIYGEIPEKLEDVVNQDDTSSPATQTKNQKPSAPRTIRGGKLPKTATNNIPGVILGGLLAITGILMYKKVSNVKKKAA